MSKKHHSKKAIKENCGFNFHLICNDSISKQYLCRDGIHLIEKVIVIRKFGKISDVTGSGRGDSDKDGDKLFCRMADRQIALSLISSRDHC